MSDQQPQEKTTITGEEAYQIIQYFQAVANVKVTEREAVEVPSNLDKFIEQDIIDPNKFDKYISIYKKHAQENNIDIDYIDTYKQIWNGWVLENLDNIKTDFNFNLDFDQNIEWIIDDNDNLDFSYLHFPKFSFNKAQFRQKANFSNAEFHQQANFSLAQFHREAYFRKAKFYQDASFNHTNFSKDTTFSDSRFHQLATFFDSRFHQLATFFDSRFYQYSSFSKSQFHQNAHFANTQFYQETDFNSSKFHQQADFKCLHFYQDVNFNYAQFYQDANFIEVYFYKSTDFDNVIFHGNAIFQESQFSIESKHTGFYSTIFKSNTDFSYCLFQRDILFRYTLFESNAIFAHMQTDIVPDMNSCMFAKPTYLMGIEISSDIDQQIKMRLNDTNLISERYQVFKKHAEELKNQPKKLDFFADEMIAKREENKTTLKGWFVNIPNYFYEWFSNYGRSAGRPLYWLVGMILFCAIILSNILTPINFVYIFLLCFFVLLFHSVMLEIKGQIFGWLICNTVFLAMAVSSIIFDTLTVKIIFFISFLSYLFALLFHLVTLKVSKYYIPNTLLSLTLFFIFLFKLSLFKNAGSAILLATTYAIPQYLANDLFGGIRDYQVALGLRSELTSQMINKDIEIFLNILSSISGVFGILFIFLIGLALRNRFLSK